MTAAAALGPRQAAVLEHLAAHPGLTAGELARALSQRSEPYKQLRRLQQQARVVGLPVWDPAQGREVTRWRVAPPGTAPPPGLAPDPGRVARRNERDRIGQAARRARARALTARPGPVLPSLRALWAAGACRTAGPDLFFGPDAEFVSARKARVAQAKAICAGCPVGAACLAYALAAREPSGVWGGTDEDERRAMLRQATRRAS